MLSGDAGGESSRERLAIVGRERCGRIYLLDPSIFCPYSMYVLTLRQTHHTSTVDTSQDVSTLGRETCFLLENRLLVVTGKVYTVYTVCTLCPLLGKSASARM